MALLARTVEVLHSTPSLLQVEPVEECKAVALLMIKVVTAEQAEHHVLVETTIGKAAAAVAAQEPPVRTDKTSTRRVHLAATVATVFPTR